jgi:hypothetical protein
VTETIPMSPKQLLELQNKMASAFIEAAEENAKRFEAISIEMMQTAAKLRAKTISIAREAAGAAVASAK